MALRNTIQKDDLIVSGYIHENYKKQNKIPQDITHLCYKYFHKIFQDLPTITDEKCDSFPLLRLNDEEILIVGPWSLDNEDYEIIGIHKYNVKSQTFELLVEFDDSIFDDNEFYNHTAALDEKNKIISIHTGKQLVTIDLKTKEIEFQDLDYNTKYTKRAVCIDDALHLLEGTPYHIHSIWERFNDKYQEIDRLLNNEKEIDIHYGLIYIKGNGENIPKTMLLFGNNSDKIFYFKFETKEWLLWKDKLPKAMNFVEESYILTPNQRYIVLFHGQEICILDLKEFPKITFEIRSQQDFKDVKEIPCVLMTNGDIHFMNFHTHKVINIKDVLLFYK